MKCQNCNERPATVHYTETINGVTKSMNICDACAAKLHGTTGFFPFFAEAFAPQEKSEHCCPSCGATIVFFNRYNKFSCPDCYNAFAPVTDRILKQIHKTNRHKTEMPAQPSKLQELSAELENAISSENYEKAAKLRDEIRELKREEAENK